MILRCTTNTSKSRPRKRRGESHYTKVLILCALLWHHVKVTGPRKRLVANSARFCATLIVHRSEPATISLITDSFSWVLLTFRSARMSRAETLQGSVHFAFDKHVPTWLQLGCKTTEKPSRRALKLRSLKLFKQSEGSDLATSTEHRCTVAFPLSDCVEIAVSAWHHNSRELSRAWYLAKTSFTENTAPGMPSFCKKFSGYWRLFRKALRGLWCGQVLVFFRELAFLEISAYIDIFTRFLRIRVNGVLLHTYRVSAAMWKLLIRKSAALCLTDFQHFDQHFQFAGANDTRLA